MLHSLKGGVKFFALFLLLCRPLHATDEASLRAALDAHHWFDMRDSVLSGRAPATYRFYVAAAFNDRRRAERELSAAIRSGVPQETLAGMHNAMSRLYYRSGHYHKAALEMRRCWAESNAPPSDEARADLAALDRLADLRVVSRHPATLRYSNWPTMPLVVAPVTINHNSVQFVLDTDAGMSVTSETEAKHLGLRMVTGQSQFEGVTGVRSAGHYAIADRLRIGNTELRDVAFIVFPDNLEVWSTVPLEQRGAVGLPVLLAVETMRWSQNHELTISFPPDKANLRGANLCFDELDPLASVEIAGRRLAVDLDTGATVSTMWPLFVKDFPDLLGDSHESRQSLSGSSGTANIRAAILPELRMTVGGFPIVFRDAPALLSTTILASNWHYGQLGIDQLEKASEVTIDFKALRIQLK